MFLLGHVTRGAEGNRSRPHVVLQVWAALGAAEQASGMTEVGLDGESPDQAA